MRAQRSDLPPPERTQAAGVTDHTVGSRCPSESQRHAVAPVGHCHSNSVAYEEARSANSMTGRVWLSVAIGAKQPPEGKPRHDAFDNLSRRATREHRGCAWGAVASPRGGGAASLRQDELDIRGRAHAALAVRASRPAHSVHQATAGGVGGRQHARLRACEVRRAPTATRIGR
jgi:hypothetical protein